MLKRTCWLALVCLMATAGVVVGGPATPALACVPEADPLQVELETCPDDDEGDSTGSDEWRCYYEGYEVDCVNEYGSWVGVVTPPLCYGPESYIDQLEYNHSVDYGDWDCMTGEGVLGGCYRSSWQSQGVPPDLEPDASGGWYRLACFGANAAPNPTPPIAIIHYGVWMSSAVTVDPRAVALSLLSRIGLSAPDIRMSPPVTGSVLLRMPLWLSTPDDFWEPVTDEDCHPSGVCVGISAQAVSIAWDMGDGNRVTCSQDQNIPWQRGMDFLNPADACHHYYQRSSHAQPDGRYQVEATATFHSEWWVISGAASPPGGEFENLTEVCGPGGNSLCQTTAAVQVVELQVLTGR